MCGLKFDISALDPAYITSHPLWVCGLKLKIAGIIAVAAPVTPFMGVWIEIQNRLSYRQMDLVTPFMGVWIEMQHVVSINLSG